MDKPAEEKSCVPFKIKRKGIMDSYIEFSTQDAEVKYGLDFS
jgi:hypothetical protein